MAMTCANAAQDIRQNAYGERRGSKSGRTVKLGWCSQGG